VRTVAGLAALEVPDGSVRILVVDDSPEGGAAEVVDNLRGKVGIAVEYFASAAADISIARNHALRLGAAGSDFVACLDDDCVPTPGWLRELLRIADQHHADVVVGHRQFVAGTAGPIWLTEEPFLAENLHYSDGSVPDRGNTANMLVRSSWQQSSGVRFRPEMGKLGGEDMVFFADAVNVGANIRFAANSICNEPCEGRRATFRYQAWRQIWLGNNEAAINRSTREVSRARLLARGAKRVLMGLSHPVRRLARRKSPQWHWSVALVGHGVGLLAGTAGIRLRHRG
jgi:succinoglycan biosynthesis protein ExoM